MGLDGMPASDLFGPVTQTWCDDLWSTRSWEQTRDAPRIDAAFREMRLHCIRWPSMSEFVKELPKLPPVSSEVIEQRIAWAENTPANRSIQAIAHCRYNAHRLKVAVPPWATHAGDREGAVLALISEIKQGVALETARIRADVARHKAENSPAVAA